MDVGLHVASQGSYYSRKEIDERFKKLSEDINKNSGAYITKIWKGTYGSSGALVIFLNKPIPLEQGDSIIQSSWIPIQEGYSR